jgi:hypothetical protein
VCKMSSNNEWYVIISLTLMNCTYSYEVVKLLCYYFVVQYYVFHVMLYYVRILQIFIYVYKLTSFCSDYTFRVVIVGDQTVGKTSLLLRFVVCAILFIDMSRRISVTLYFCIVISSII